MKWLIGILIRLTFGELLCLAVLLSFRRLFGRHCTSYQSAKAIKSDLPDYSIVIVTGTMTWHSAIIFVLQGGKHNIILQSAINHQALTLSSSFVYFERVAQSKCQYESWRWSTNKSPWFMLFAYLATITIRKHSSLSPHKPTQINRHRDYWDFSRPPESNNRDLFHFIDRGWCGAQRRVIRMVSRPATGGRGVPFNYTSNRRRHELPALPGSQLFFPFLSFPNSLLSSSHFTHSLTLSLSPTEHAQHLFTCTSHAANFSLN